MKLNQLEASQQKTTTVIANLRTLGKERKERKTEMKADCRHTVHCLSLSVARSLRT